jgi:hypothetical protein
MNRIVDTLLRLTFEDPAAAKNILSHPVVHLRSAILHGCQQVKPVLWLITGVLVSVFFSIGSIELTATAVGGTQVLFEIWGTVFLGAVLIPIALVIRILKACFTQSRHERLKVIICSYVGIILTFSGVYYSLAGFGDLDEAGAIYDRAVTVIKASERIGGPDKKLPELAERAFNGIRPRLFEASEEYERISREGFAFDPHSPANVGSSARSNASGSFPELSGFYRPLKSVVHYHRERGWLVYGDCLHFSIITIATVGYGDISPNQWYSKWASDIEVLSGVAIFGLAIALLFASAPTC